jgi:hypothetical protein
MQQGIKRKWQITNITKGNKNRTVTGNDKNL